MKRGGYWERRCERWGAWRIGHGFAKVANYGGPRVDCETQDAQPVSFEEETETDLLVRHLASKPETADLARFALAAYPGKARLARELGIDQSALDERRKGLHRKLSLLLDQRRRGEQMDVSRRRPRGRSITTRAEVPGHDKPVPIASVVLDA